MSPPILPAALFLSCEVHWYTPVSLISSWHHLNKTRMSPKPSSLRSKPGFYWNVWISDVLWDVSLATLVKIYWLWGKAKLNIETSFDDGDFCIVTFQDTLNLNLNHEQRMSHGHGTQFDYVVVAQRRAPLLDRVTRRTCCCYQRSSEARFARESYCPHFEKTWQTGKDEGCRGAQRMQKTR